MGDQNDCDFFLFIQYIMPLLLIFFLFVAVNDNYKKGKKVVPLLIFGIFVVMAYGMVSELVKLNLYYDRSYNILSEITNFKSIYDSCVRQVYRLFGVWTELGGNIKTLLYQVPGGMLSNLVSQLKEAGAEDKYRDVLEEIPRVRKDYGEPPLVTPSSQIVGTQAVLNVLQGERYKMITKESKKVLAGEFGQTIKPFNPEVQKKAIGDTKPITCRPADLIEPQLEKFKNDPIVQQYKQQDEDVLSYALFPQVATEFFKYREAQQTKVDPTKADTANKAYPV